jgi:hypothetical protein
MGLKYGGVKEGLEFTVGIQGTFWKGFPRPQEEQQTKEQNGNLVEKVGEERCFVAQ